jgi:hypothetical protein
MLMLCPEHLHCAACLRHNKDVIVDYAECADRLKREPWKQARSSDHRYVLERQSTSVITQFQQLTVLAVR